MPDTQRHVSAPNRVAENGLSTGVRLQEDTRTELKESSKRILKNTTYADVVKKIGINAIKGRHTSEKVRRGLFSLAKINPSAIVRTI
jgi:hypothetical protein